MDPNLNTTRRLQRVLVFIDHYLPGFKFGGPVRTIANLVNQLSSDYEFFVFTSDRDKGDSEAYENVPVNQWITVKNAKVFYTANRSVRSILQRVEEVSPDLIYLNSFFSRVSIRVLLARNLRLLSKIPVILAPRGEFAAGALVIKPVRKNAYIRFVNGTRMLKGISLQASTEFEKKDIERHLHVSKSPGRVTLVASNIAAPEPNGSPKPRISKSAGLLRLIYLARISRNKNLNGALQILKGVSGKIIFTICGPIDDPEYWNACQESIRQLPANISVQYRGMVKHEMVPDVLSKQDLLFLPTHGENYGHVIVEALSAGCPVLISDRTPWRNLEELGIGADVSLHNIEKFQRVLQRFVEMGEEGAIECSLHAVKYAIYHRQDKTLVQQNVRMFAEVLKTDGDSDT